MDQNMDKRKCVVFYLFDFHPVKITKEKKNLNSPRSPNNCFHS